MIDSIASLLGAVLRSLDPREPSRCPYCPDRPEPHWIGWGCYRRYAEGRDRKIDVDRHRCPFVCRTFSLLPDGLLPYHHARTATILRHLLALFVKERPLSTWARLKGVARSTLRGLKARVALTLAKLRLPGQEGALSPAPFVTRLLDLGAERVAEIFRAWKELEPKHSIVGFYVR